MKPIVKVASTVTPDGSEFILSRHDRDFIFTVNNQRLMSSREHESEEELARLACHRAREYRDPVVLVGGLGMGYTLRETLKLLGKSAKVVVSELLPDVVKWNRDHLGHLTDHPLRDPRVTVKIGDVMELVRDSHRTFDVIMLDVDNGPDPMTDRMNSGIYTREGIQACMDALHGKGILAFWSCSLSSGFETRIKKTRAHTARFRVAPYKGARALSRCIWVLSRNRPSLPPLPERHARERQEYARQAVAPVDEAKSGDV